MRFHLKEHHKAVFTTLKSSANKTVYNAQATLLQVMSASQPLPTSCLRWNKLTDAVVYFICKDMQPLSTIDDVGFRHMAKAFEPRYTPSSRKTISAKHLPLLYESVKAKILALAHEAQSFAVTTDIWTSRANHAYIGITIHFFSSSFELHHYLLETRVSRCSHWHQHSK